MRCPFALAALLLTAPAVAQQAPRPPARAATAARAEAARTAADVARAEAARAAETARDAEAEGRRLAERRVEAARRALAAEARLLAARDRARLAAADAAAARDLAAHRAAALAPLLPVLRRLALWPAESLLAAPVPPEDALRGLLLLRGLTRDAAEELAELRAAQAEAARRAALAAAGLAEQEAAEAALRTAAAAVDEALQDARARRTAAEAAEAAAAGRAAAGAARAEDLEAALSRLDHAPARPRPEPVATRPTEPPAATRDPPRAAGGFIAPVAGRPLRGFGEATEAGPSRGITWSAVPGARVVSPCDGRAVFAAPFRSYGGTVIVECGDGLHAVLAGLDRVDVTPGERLLAGAPVGVLPARPAATLYMELRRRGQPVDPRTWQGSRG